MNSLEIYLPFIIDIPLIIVWIVGIILSLKIKNQNKRVSTLTIAGLGIALAVTVGGFIAHVNILSQYTRGNISGDSLSTANNVLQIIRMVGLSTTFILILIAIFKPRPKK